MSNNMLVHIDNYIKEGVEVISDFFSVDEMSLIDTEVSQLIKSSNVPKVYENNNNIPRSLHNCEMHSELFKNITALPRMINLMKMIFADDVYLQQFKINLKYAFHGDVWQWHQDYAYYYKEDKILKPRLVNAIIFLDDISEYNAPLYYIPESHHEGLLSIEKNIQFNKLVKDVGWEKNFKAEMKYKLSNDIVTKMVEKYGLKSAKGSKGSLMLLHSNVVHASPPNISPFNRRMIFITYNAISNRPNYIDDVRKGVASSAQNEPIVALDSDALEPVASFRNSMTTG